MFVRSLELGFTAPRKLLVIFDYFIHESSGDYFAAQSYTGGTFKEIPNYKLDGSINFLRDQLDFRPAVGELASGNGTIGAHSLLTVHLLTLLRI